MSTNDRSTRKIVLQGFEVAKHFGGVIALDGLDFALHDGEILGLIGPNGSGKTTLFNVISGIIASTSGRILLGEKAIDNLASHVIASLGISRTFQNVRLFIRLSVIMNVKIGAHLKARTSLASTVARSRAFRQAEQDVEERARHWLAFVGLEHREDELALNLPYGERKLLELARALASEPRVLLLDEPAAGLNPNEVADLSDVIMRLREMNLPVFVVEHNMRLVMEICDYIIAINFGKNIAEGSPRDIQDSPAVQEAYLGSNSR